MRSLSRQRQYLWTTTKNEGGFDGFGMETTSYTKPERHKFSVSATSGTPFELSVGNIPTYDRYITSYDRDFSPVEGTLVFIDVIPSLDEEGALKRDSDGNYETLPDYVIVRKLDTQRGNVARFGVQKRTDET